jgi:hypothetical protein
MKMMLVLLRKMTSHLLQFKKRKKLKMIFKRVMKKNIIYIQREMYGFMILYLIFGWR